MRTAVLFTVELFDKLLRACGLHLSVTFLSVHQNEKSWEAKAVERER